jgi:hypothetical protein
LRFTLYWVGDEELCLSVTTPAWQTLNSAITGAKDASSGALWEYTNDVSGVHIRDLFFPGGVLVGKYTYSVGGWLEPKAMSQKITACILKQQSNNRFKMQSIYIKKQS